MDVRKLSSALPVLNSNKNKKITDISQARATDCQTSSLQNNCQQLGAKVERIKQLDISLYEEVQRIPNQEKGEKLFYLSVNV